MNTIKNMNIKGKIGLGIITFFIIIAIFAPLISPYNPSDMVGMPYLSPSKDFLFGTDRMGRDILSQLIYGTRLSLIVGLSTGLLMTTISVTLGMTAGYFGGVVDRIISTIIDIFLVIPGLPLMIVISSYIKVRGVLPIILVISFTSWGPGARVMRSQAMTLRNREFVTASRITGENHLSLIFSEIMPNMLSLIGSNFFTAVLTAIIGEASLEFLGFGDVSATTWGTMLYWAQNSSALLNQSWTWVLAPGVAIALLGASFALLNFSLDELTNPKLRGE
ncbi:ABC transporter permease [Oceanotoga sp. DSM 15011]|jgi:peptide/nickel transport system permease protein|uniref:Peptide/nickel transport system permease protein n=1 Tax=Oceanotoga teriensis TaxID=515440 RepID=A0AA45HIL6_9BACT|nr:MULTISPECIES: ABC transporter permease [Oceanotoga]MDN5342031.1 peptide/nickel transport system permease protein [Oceanotoga sp.]MDO7976009.1 ABC transporter permease [Oceanotoga teriensis]PWJ92049.1 peptide/nickel transport system permease protein [Oceanotoga teriensis]UYO98996.1 ABC transporter permease [Oceanotoga sp. DSM 15011]